MIKNKVKKENKVMVYHKMKVERAAFRNLPKGNRYWVPGALAVAPSTKTDNKNSLTGMSLTTGDPTLTAVTPTSTQMIKVPKQFLGQKGR